MLLQFGKVDKHGFVLDFGVSVEERHGKPARTTTSLRLTIPPAWPVPACLTVCMQYPLSILQAFAIALASMDSKVSEYL